MKVNLFNQNTYKNKFLLNGLEFAANNGALFVAGTSLTLSTIIRPLVILATPKTDKQNKQLALIKSLASSAGGYLLILAASIPIAASIKKIDKNPAKYLNSRTIAKLGKGEPKITNSKTYQFATQLFKLGLGAVMATPKSIFTNMFITPFIALNNKIHKKNEKQTYSNNLNSQSDENKTKDLVFKGKGSPLTKGEPLTRGIAKILNMQCFQNFADRFKDTNFAMHIMAITDAVATLTLIDQVNRNKHINNDRKRVLNYNSAIATGLSIGCSYTADAALDGVTDKFIKKFTEANKNSPKLGKYLEGIKIAKPTLILGITYYTIIPFISTFLAERIDRASHTAKKDKTTI